MYSVTWKCCSLHSGIFTLQKTQNGPQRHKQRLKCPLRQGVNYDVTMLDTFTGVNSLNFHNCAFYYYFITFTHFSLSLSLLFTGQHQIWHTSNQFRPHHLPATHKPVSQAESCSEFKPCTVHKVEVSFTRCHCSVATGLQSLDYRMDIQWHPSLKMALTTTHILVLKKGAVLSRVHLHGKARCVCRGGGGGWRCVCV